SAYELLKPRQGLASLGWSSQRDVWIPFHFIPPHPFDFEKPRFSFVTRPGSRFAEMVFYAAATEAHPLRRLCRIGVALHTLADSWSHQGFSGQRSPEENDVEALAFHSEKAGRFKTPLVENIVDGPLPMLGHAEALYFPDVPHMRWRCEIGPGKKPAGGANTDRFLRASKRIYDRLRQARTGILRLPSAPVPWRGGQEDSLSWRQLRPLLKERFQYRPLPTETFVERLRNLKKDLKARCEAWKQGFGHWFDGTGGESKYGIDPKYLDTYEFNHMLWRDDAMEGDTNWDTWPLARFERQEPFVIRKKRKYFWESRWVHFHRAALAQRHFVLQRLP
ncbi:MAG: hypothetical protein PVJ32_06860, partial [Anaerolineales bacterium]